MYGMAFMILLSHDHYLVKIFHEHSAWMWLWFCIPSFNARVDVGLTLTSDSRCKIIRSRSRFWSPQRDSTWTGNVSCINWIVLRDVWHFALSYWNYCIINETKEGDIDLLSVCVSRQKNVFCNHYEKIVFRHYNISSNGIFFVITM